MSLNSKQTNAWNVLQCRQIETFKSTIVQFTLQQTILLKLFVSHLDILLAWLLNIQLWEFQFLLLSASQWEIDREWVPFERRCRFLQLIHWFCSHHAIATSFSEESAITAYRLKYIENIWKLMRLLPFMELKHCSFQNSIWHFRVLFLFFQLSSLILNIFTWFQRLYVIQ